MEAELNPAPRSETLAERDADWFLLIRRWSGVPDLVGDEIALSAACDSMAATIDSELKQKYPKTHFHGDARFVISRVVELGNAGELDWFLMGWPGPQGIGGLDGAAKFCLRDRDPSEFLFAVATEL